MGILSSVKASSRRALALVVAAVLTCMLAIAAAGSILATQAQAAPSDPYKYTVRIYSGAQGTFKGGSTVWEKVVEPNSQIDFQQSSVQLDNGSKYYIRGIKRAGRDNDTTFSMPSFKVTGDIDLVVSYGVLGDNVQYTVRYVDADGAELLPSETFYGNVGDSPVIAYRYIEGYTPQAYNLTGKLLANAEKNVYTFTYSANEEGEAPATEPAQQAPATAPAAGAAAAGADAVADVVPETDIPDDANPLAGGDEQPAEVQDIRDNDNPLALFEKLLGDEASLITFEDLLPVLGALIGVIALAIVVLVLLRKRRKDQELAYQTARSEVMSDGAQHGASKSDASDSGSGGNGRTA